MKTKLRLILIHLFFWALYIIVWGLRDMAYAPTFLDTIDGNILGSLIFSIGIYLNLYLFIPRLLLKNRRGLYVVALSFIIVLMGVISSVVFGAFYKNIDLSTSEYFASIQGMVTTASDFLVVYGFSTCLYFINEWYLKERKINALENQSLKAELDLLKGQINPHFLFNALNSVHVLIRKDTDKAQKTLEKFSDLLSHQLYDVEKDQISLSQEVQNLDNFIELQKMRHEDHMDVKWSFDGFLDRKSIAPMLFLNFVENAFKHSSANGEENIKVEISLTLVGDQLTFTCRNTVFDTVIHDQKVGLGIANVRRRLDIIYPRRYELFTERDGNTYLVYFKLDLSEG